MTIATEFNDWQHLPPPAVHTRCSPNLVAVLVELQRRWPSTGMMGCFGARPIRGSKTIPSSHSQGAAIDVSYPGVDDQMIADEVAPFLVGRSAEMHIQAVHDYRRCRIWRAGRTDDESEACTAWWRAQRPSSATGMGQSWANHLHLEVTVAGWDDGSLVSGRWLE